MAADEVVATAAASTLGLLRSEAWSMVAAQLLTFGHDGPDLLALACLEQSSTRWQIDPLVPGALQDIQATDVNIESGGEIVARLLAQTTLLIDEYILLRTLARLAPDLDYPGGVIGVAYSLAEWLDCDCHRQSRERAAAEAFEREIRTLPYLNIPRDFSAILIT